jgi:hypothetical protein
MPSTIFLMLRSGASFDTVNLTLRSPLLSEGAGVSKGEVHGSGWGHRVTKHAQRRRRGDLS